MLIYVLFALTFAWLVALELRHNGLKGLVSDSKALAQQAATDARKALSKIKDR